MRRVLAYIKVYYKFPRRALLAAQTWILVIFIPLENSGEEKHDSEAKTIKRDQIWTTQP